MNCAGQIHNKLFAVTMWLLLCGAKICLAQAAPPSATPPVPAFASEKAKAEAIGKVRLLADQIHALKMDAARVQGLAAVGRAACPYDKAAALEIFQRANEIVQRAQSREAASLRRSLLPQVARCDADLAFRWRAARLEEEAGRTDDAITDLSTARELLDADPSLAARFLGPALEQLPDTPLQSAILQNAMITLMDLRKRNMEASDALFLSLLAALRRELRPEANRLLLIGNYLFTSPPFPGIPEQFRGAGIMFTTVGAGRPGGVSTLNLSEDRPGMNPALVRPYLEAALDILSRPVQDPKLQAEDFVALHQLAGKAPVYAPDLVPQFALLRERLQGNVSETLRQPSSYEILTRLNSGVSTEERLAAEPDPAKRDAMRLNSLAAAWTRNDIGEARKRAEGIEDKDVREFARQMVQFFDAGKAIADGRLQTAEELVRPMPPGAKRILLALGLAVALQEKNERDAAEAWWKLAAIDARAVDYRARASLLLAVASVGMRFDHEVALGVLDESVRAFNSEATESSQVGRPVPEGVSPGSRMASKAGPLQDRTIIRSYGGGFLEEIYLRDYPNQFRLTVRGVDAWDFTPVLMSRVGTDAERAHAIVLKLVDEGKKANALSSLAGVYILNATKKSAPAETTNR